MKRTPHYLMQFYQRGDMYSASEDLQRMTTIDNQLIDLAETSGDGVLFGWNVYPTTDVDPLADPLSISVSLGSGIISSLYQTSLGIKTGTLIDNAKSYIYLQTSVFNNPGGFPVEVQGPLSSPPASAVFTDTTAPSAPTNFNGVSVAYDIINLTWDANTELDVTSYEIQRNQGGPYVTIATVGQNGTLSNPFQDTNLSGGTNYYYQIRAIDKSGNVSPWTPISSSFVTTLPDTRIASEVKGLSISPSDGQLSIAFQSSSTENLQSYKITVDLLKSDGTIDSTVATPPESLATSYQIAVPYNNRKYRVTVQTRANSNDGTTPPGNLSTGVIIEGAASKTSAPYNPVNPLTTPGIGNIVFNWSPSPSPTASINLAVTGYKTKYLIIPIIDEKEALPIDVGLATTATVYGYNEFLSVGFSSNKKFQERVQYLFKICTEDGFGNRSAGALVFGSVQITTRPNKPRAFYAEPGDKQVLLKWNHSTSEGVVGYGISLGGPDVLTTPYINEWLLTGLTNDVPTTIKIRTKNDANLYSDYINTVVTPTEDTSLPPIPLHVRLTSSDSQVQVSWGKIERPDIIKYIIQKTLVNAPSNFSPNINVEVIATYIIDVGMTSSFVDTALDNGKQYGYAVSAVRLNPSNNQIQGNYSSTYYISPNQGLNSGPDRILAPTDAVAVFNGTSNEIDLTWNFYFHDMVFNVITGLWEYPVGDSPTAFNIYRSEDEFSNYQLINTINAGLRSYSDKNLVGGKTYYYIIGAMRDNLLIVLDTGSIQPVHSLLVGTATTKSGSIVSASNEKRIVNKLYSTIKEETERRLILHKHTNRPTNISSVNAQSSITMIEINELRKSCFSNNTFTCADTINPEYIFLYKNAVIAYLTDITTSQVNTFPSADGIPISGLTTVHSKGVSYTNYDSNTVYLIDPRLVTWNPPFVGDYQVLVNNQRPTVSFSINHDINAIVFQEALKSTDVVRLDGQGLTFYVPARIDRRFTGYDVEVNGVKNQSVQVDEIRQTVTFPTPIDMNNSPVVSLALEPTVPTFNVPQGPSQINLSPDTVLNDFVARGQSVFQSLSGGFQQGDVVFALVNGERTGLDHYVDFNLKQIVFTLPLPIGTTVALEIKGIAETQKELPESRIIGIDGSQVKTGELLKAQLPRISHAGRMNERAYPIFNDLFSNENYVYASTDVLVGNGTTTYDFYIFDDGNFMLGTSNGILKTYLIPGFLLSSSDNLLLNSTTPVGAGLNFTVDTIVDAALLGIQNSGRIHGILKFPALDLSSTNVDVTVQDPSICFLDNGKIFIVGGIDSKACYVYDTLTQTALEVPSMSTNRSYHTCVRLPDGRVMVCGGIIDQPSSCVCLPQAQFDILDKTDGIIGSWFLKSAELYDPSSGPLGSWSALPNMSAKRMNHAAVVIDPNDPNSPVVVAGGKWSHRVLPSSTYLQSVQDSCFDIYFCDPTDTPDIRMDDEISTAEIFNTTTLTWSNINPMIFAGETCKAKTDNQTVAITTTKARQVYDYVTNTWQATSGQCEVTTIGLITELDGPAKEFIEDNKYRIIAATRKKIYYSEDRANSWVEMKGLDSIGTIHSITQAANNTLFAATDLGVYEIKDNVGITWLQGGLIGAGTTETFSVQPIENDVLAGTEIGIYKTSDDGDTWSEMIDIPNVVSIVYAGNGVVYAISVNELYKSDDYGNVSTWIKVGSYPFIDQNSKLAFRMPFELFISSSQGLYSSADGLNFSLVEFDRNKNITKNSVQAIRMIGSDLYISYDNEVIVLDPSGLIYRLAEFTGIVPTVRVNGVEVKNGYRYNTKKNEVIFETKRFSDDTVTLASNYSLYQLDGGWYSQNPNATLQVYVDQILQPDSAFIYDSRLGEFSFKNQLEKFNQVTVSIANTTLKNGGMYFHDELEDKLEKEKGLALSMGRDFAGNVLQMGLDVEHNFLERGLERNQYYCLETSLVDRSFTSFLLNSEFFILGRKDFDRFNSTIDYKIEAQQPLIGTAALVPLSALLYSTSEYWIGTDSGIFVVDPTSLFALSEAVEIEKEDNPIRDINFALDGAYAATKLGIYRLYKNGSITEYEKNPGEGLPDEVFSVNVLNNILLAGTSDGMYYATSFDDPPYSVWLRASHIPQNGQQIELTLDGKVDALLVNQGTAYAFIGKDLFISTDGKIWKKVFSFVVSSNPNDKIRVSKMTFFGGNLVVATNKGIYDDDGSVKSDQVTFKFNIINITETDSIINMNYIASNEDVLYAGGNTNYLFKLRNRIWTKESISDAKAIHLVDIVDGTVLVVENNTIYTE